MDHPNVTEMLTYLKKKLKRVAAEKGSLTDHDVVAVSQQLDRYVNLAQRHLTLALASSDDYLKNA